MVRVRLPEQDGSVLAGTAPRTRPELAAHYRSPRIAAIVGAYWLTVLVAMLASPVGETVAAEASPDQASATGVNGKVKSSTGFFVSKDGVVLTTAHGIADCKIISVWPNGTEARSAHLIASDQRLDIAVLSTDGPTPRYAAAAGRAYLNVGEPVVAIGLGVHVKEPLLPVIIEGSFAGDGRTPAGDPVLLIHASVPRGASGAPVLDAAGSLIGMVIGYYADRPNLGVVRSFGDITNFLAQNGVAMARNGPVVKSSRLLNDLLVNMSVLVQCAAVHM
jgi:S1-C subfamily serine protease